MCTQLWMTTRRHSSLRAPWGHETAGRLDRLDQAYLEIFGDHPGLPARVGKVIPMRTNVTVYEYAERPDVEVRMRWQDDAGAWWLNVQWRPPGEHTRKLDNFPADRVRPT